MLWWDHDVLTVLDQPRATAARLAGMHEARGVSWVTIRLRRGTLGIRNKRLGPRVFLW